jgi:ribosomal protein S18 acetylase RimI-like enzyme|tara:strand:- start:5 stop:472 length:468 start_codon:yes stop_codon:yes gene_type:complete
MQLRKAAKKDSEQIAEVLLSFYNLENSEEAKNAFLNEIKKGHHYIVAEDENKIIGLVTWLMHGLPKHELAELDRIVTLKESRGKGVGKLLVDELIKHANSVYSKAGFKLRKLYLLTHADNKEAHSFYKKTGFKHETTLKEHYYKEKDEFVFSMFF